MMGLNPIKRFVENLLLLLINYSEGHIHCNTLGERGHVNRTEQNKTFILQLNSGHAQVAYEIKHYICQK